MLALVCSVPSSARRRIGCASPLPREVAAIAFTALSLDGLDMSVSRELAGGSNATPSYRRPFRAYIRPRPANMVLMRHEPAATNHIGFEQSYRPFLCCRP